MHFRTFSRNYSNSLCFLSLLAFLLQAFTTSSHLSSSLVSMSVSQRLSPLNHVLDPNDISPIQTRCVVCVWCVCRVRLLLKLLSARHHVGSFVVVLVDPPHTEMHGARHAHEHIAQTMTAFTRFAILPTALTFSDQHVLTYADSDVGGSGRVGSDRVGSRLR